MQRSEVFRDMFSMCDSGESGAGNNAQGAFPPSAVPGGDPDLNKAPPVVDLDESADTLTILLKLLHDPPKPPVEISTDPYTYQKKYDTSTVIPLPLLELVILKLIDKYLFDEEIVKGLEAHLLAHAPENGLRVYGIAMAHYRADVANIVTQYLLPLAKYSKEEVKAWIPSVEAFHDILRFQDFRVQALRDLVLNEDIFPHGYGECSAHRDSTRSAWDTRRKSLLARIETGQFNL
ncbi:hypothetical protein CC1G_04429 [Coprinopsis cinerea okayama7|uniref:Uncharacterized protein n=1 Tax=Coprinopsis cinerea (strain Okayama-7 / 130 / ATCC MYA-4618 / FGSC 9003) TaxID=240176 RepID=A8N0K8_COPC7|nr:hypothetical protein CC1G_04429 [Coprinopsis cinerea okayama7\|eukprot:XP_001828458.2 hypothetical protein CC1G_04429 [Coprinopsis cinerea okayama7\